MRSAIPDVDVSWVVNDTLSDVVRLCPGVSRIIPFPRKHLLNPCKMMDFTRELRKESYDVCIDFQGLLRSGIMTTLCKANDKVGFAHAREGAPLFYGRRCVISDMHTHAVDKNIRLTRFALDIPEPVPIPPPQIELPKESVAEMDTIAPIRGGSPILAVCFSSRWHSKNWSPEFIAKCIDETAKAMPNARAFLVGANDDKTVGDRLASLCETTKPVNLAGKTTMFGLAALLSRAAAMFTVDSGPMHLAAAIGVPCVAMFGATDNVLTGPYGPEGFHTIIHANCEKSPCFKHECPLGGNCADHASVQETANAILEQINRQTIGGKQ